MEMFYYWLSFKELHMPFLKKQRNEIMNNSGRGFAKYLRYAFGEIILAVIGILIALYINGWYQDQEK